MNAAPLHSVDVAGVLERAGANASAAPGTHGWALAQIAALFVVLVDVDLELDRAQAAYASAVREARVYPDAAAVKAARRLNDARKARARALSAVSGDQS